ncbi:calcium-activated chloride channel regulator family member 3-like [Strongylocentrotus purpuratus]|uniref:Calcium-activated chloride channel N-terminal domain-containing protein n=1 Tax=Strongylocentrotus purpuratus TaxID=7668 RepID=A0A7M7N578_STRPU|nr:calcium-activated chloride channel regulator family member 3-like [Strongylocentrotus purpuratus]
MLVERPSLSFYLLVCLMGTKICKAQQDTNPIELENGAYNNILIAIHKDVEEDSIIIENIKDIFRAGSSVLFSATNRRVYFGTITILVPPTWSRNSEYQVAQRKVIARQFAKLRWGVFDEDYVPGTDAEPYYQSNAITSDGFEGTRCSSEVLGKLLIDGVAGEECRPDNFGDLPPLCRFVPDDSGQTARASLLFVSNIYSV